MILSRNKKNNVYPCKPQFYYIKVGFKGSTLYRRVFVMNKNVYDRLNSLSLSKSWQMLTILIYTLMLSTLGELFRRRHIEIFSYFCWRHFHEMSNPIFLGK